MNGRLFFLEKKMVTIRRQQEPFVRENFSSTACRTVALIVCALYFAGPQLSAAAEPEDWHPYLEHKFSLDLGIFYPDRELDLRVNGSLVGDNVEIDFDKRRQIKTADVIFSTQFSWRIGEKWALIGQFFDSTDYASVVLEEDIEWENVVFGAGSNAAVGSKFTLTRMFFGRHLEMGRSHDIGIGGGIHWLSIGAFIEGEIIINGAPAAARRSVSAEAPLPNIGAWYRYSVSPRWALRARVDLLSADVGMYDGLLLNVAVGVNYRALEHFGIGLNYNYLKLDIGIDKSDWRGNFQTVYDGVYVYASFYY